MRIAFAASFAHWGAWNPTWLLPEKGKMLGGGETALIHTSNLFAKMGHEVHVITATDKEALYGPEDGKVHWHPVPVDNTGFANEAACVDLLVRNGPWDVVIGCDMPTLFRAGGPIVAKLRVLDSQCNHGVRLGFTETVDLVVARSWWHVKALSMLVPGQLQSQDQWAVVPNAIDPKRYVVSTTPKAPHRLIWSSSPDRGLHHMLRIFSLVRAQIPDAELHVYYEWESWFERVKWNMDRQAEAAWIVKRAAETQPGVTFFGGVNQWQLARAQLEARMFAYPCDTIRPSEGFCITALENMAAGNICLLSACDALPEVYGGTTMIMSLPIVYEAWAEIIVGCLNGTFQPKEVKKMLKQGHRLAGRYVWPNVAKHYMKHLEKALKRVARK